MDKNIVAGLFDSIAGTYDRFNHILSLNIDRMWRRRGVKRLDHSERLLDVATGTADLAMEIIRQNKADCITGIDISTGMMEVGKVKVDKAGMSGRISFLEASAFDMPFEDAVFDAVTCAYGIRNFSDLDKGLSEMYRVLRDGGQLMILEFSYPDNPFVRYLYDFLFTRVMPVVGKAVSHDKSPYLYFRNSVKSFIWGEEMASRIRSAGFSDVSFKTMSLGITTLYLARKQSMAENSRT